MSFVHPSMVCYHVLVMARFLSIKSVLWPRNNLFAYSYLPQKHTSTTSPMYTYSRNKDNASIRYYLNFFKLKKIKVFFLTPPCYILVVFVCQECSTPSLEFSALLNLGSPSWCFMFHLSVENFPNHPSPLLNKHRYYSLCNTHFLHAFVNHIT